jgi:hypothetical protein
MAFRCDLPDDHDEIRNDRTASTNALHAKGSSPVRIRCAYLTDFDIHDIAWRAA